MQFAIRDLVHDRARFLLDVASVAAAVVVILLLAGYRAGVYRQATSYLEHSPGSLVVAEQGVRNFMGTASLLPPDAATQVAALPGVASVTSVVSQFVVFERHGRKDGFVLIGYEPPAKGGPWRLLMGREPRAGDELVIDQVVARQHALGIGDTVAVLDRALRVVGLSADTTLWAGSLAFATARTVEDLLRSPGVRSHLLVTQASNTDLAQLITAITALDLEAVPKTQMIENDRHVLGRVYDTPIGLMVAAAFVVGVAVVGLVIHTATAERRREYGALKAIGARNGVLVRIVIAQALAASLLGGLVGVVLAMLASGVLTVWRPQFRVDLEAASVVAVLAGTVVMALLGAIVPARAIGRLEPSEALRE